VKCPTSPKKINKALLKKNILGGLDLGNNSMLLCCTEMTSNEDIDEFINVLRGLH
jgi:glycine cleavage system pyridoxal-binding protein P